jgi:hypothetical protein
MLFLSVSPKTDGSSCWWYICRRSSHHPKSCTNPASTSNPDCTRYEERFNRAWREHFVWPTTLLVALPNLPSGLAYMHNNREAKNIIDELGFRFSEEKRLSSSPTEKHEVA